MKPQTSRLLKLSLLVSGPRATYSTASTLQQPLWRRVARKPFRKLFGLLGGIGITTYAYYSIMDDTFQPRMERIRKVAGLFLPSLLEYKWNTWFVLRNSSEEEKAAKYLELDKKWAPRYFDTIVELRGTYVKIGQVILTRPDILESEEFRRVLAPLLDTIPQTESSKIEAIVCRNLNIASLDEVFAEFNPVALGTASIAQVHAAKLKSGEDVVIKVRLPDVGETFDLDLLSMEAMIRMAQPEMMPAHKEIRNMVSGELDFRNEGQAMKEIGDGIRSSGLFPNVIIPTPIPGLCTDEVLVMTRLFGEKLYTRVLEHYETFAKGMGMTLEELKAEMVEKFKKGEDEGPVGLRMLVKRPKVVWAAVRTWIYEVVGWWLPTFVANLGRTATFQPKLSYPIPPLPTNHQALFTTVVQVHGFQVMSLGYFNGDAHAGNIFLLDDGKIGLLDFGATRKLTSEERLNLAKNIELLCAKEMDKEKIAMTTKSLGFVSEKNLDYVG